VDHKYTGISPAPVTKKALDQAFLTVDQLDLMEAIEAFAAQSIAVARELNLNPEKVNVNVGASGARILVTLLHEMLKSGKVTDMATLCMEAAWV